MQPGVAELVVVFGGLGVVAALFAIGIVDGLVWAPRRQRRRLEIWSSVGSRSGLEVADRGAGFFRLSGAIDGTPIQVGIERVGRGRRSPARTVARGVLAPPLDLGLAIAPSFGLEPLLVGPLADVLGGPDITLGRSRIDGPLAVRGDEEARVRALLGPEVLDALEALIVWPNVVRVIDAGISVVRPRMCDDPAWLEGTARAVARLASTLRARATSVPPATALLPHREQWRLFARQRGLVYTDTPFGIRGLLDGTAVSATAVRQRRGQYALEVMAFFPAPLADPFVLLRHDSTDLMTLLFEPLLELTGDPRFDEVFVIRSTRLGVVPRLLDAQVRGAMLQLRSEGLDVLVRPEGVALRAPATAEPAAIPSGVDRIRAVAARIAQNLASTDRR